jgi:hypothetical protein
MKWWGLAGAISVLFAATLVEAAEQSEAAQPSRWQVDYGESRCTLSRVFGDNAPISLGIRISPGNEAADLIVVNPAWSRGDRLPERVEVVLQPSGARLPAAFARSSPVPSARHQFLRLSGVDRRFFDLFATATGLSLEGSGRELVSVPLSQTRGALTALRTCHDDLMRAWGVDPAVVASLQRWPMPLGDTDRMMSSDEDMTEGDSTAFFAIIRYTIGTNGRVGACDLVWSGGDQSIGDVLCQRARRGARYEPAIGADGQPVAVQFIQTMTIVRRRTFQ